jgi:hypothetical protein
MAAGVAGGVVKMIKQWRTRRTSKMSVVEG